MPTPANRKPSYKHTDIAAMVQRVEPGPKLVPVYVFKARTIYAVDRRRPA